MILTISRDEINEYLTRSPKTADVLRLEKLEHDAAVFKLRLGVPVKVTLSRFRIEDDWLKTDMKPKFLGYLAERLTEVDADVLKIGAGRFEFRLPASITARLDITTVSVLPDAVRIEGCLK